jgi:hypothetical protein
MDEQDLDFFFEKEAPHVFNQQFDFVKHGLKVVDFTPATKDLLPSYNKRKARKINLYYRSPFCAFCKTNIRWIYIGQSATEKRVFFMMENYELATIDHIVPRSHGGVDNLSNMQVACYRCNNDKQNMHNDDFINMVTKCQNK